MHVFRLKDPGITVNLPRRFEVVVHDVCLLGGIPASPHIIHVSNIVYINPEMPPLWENIDETKLY